jgi:AMMECR1 domain-containing protein
MEPVQSDAQLDASIYGVVVKAADGRRGVLLPDIEGVNTPRQQIEIARRKAGIGSDEPLELFRFSARCFEEQADEHGIR